MGMQEDLEAIKGFEDAWRHPEHPVFAPKGNFYFYSSNRIYLLINYYIFLVLIFFQFQKKKKKKLKKKN